MTDELKTKMMADTRPDYEPPRALRLAGCRDASGQCTEPGASDTVCSGTGNTASEVCATGGGAP
jgi:putative hemolysin